MVRNVLAERYASAAMRAVWSTERRVVLERELWLVVLRAQRDAGAGVPDGVVEAYEAVAGDVDLKSIARRERVTRHDVKARVEEFSALAGHEHIHRALTSRDVTENVEQALLREALRLVCDRLVAVLARTADLAERYADLVVVGRTHNVPAQVTTLGKRWATAGEEVLAAYLRLEGFLAGYPLRGLKGPVGTQVDLVGVLGSQETVDRLEQQLAHRLGFDQVMGSVGQTYPRSFDTAAVSLLVGAVAPLANLATTVRLMAGHDLVSEGATDGQVGSTAMPHKVNTRSCERIAGLMTVLRGHLTMAAGLAGDQWNEGDVSCSVVRRVVLPDACFAADGAIETALCVLDGFTVHEAMVDAELRQHLPFLLSTRLLALAVEAGCGREEAHAIISQHLTDKANWGRETADGTAGRVALASCAGDPRLRLDPSTVHALVENPAALTGQASQQVTRFVTASREVTDAHPALANYIPEPAI